MDSPLGHIARRLDRLDAGGWLLLLCGAAVVALTVLTPPYLAVRRLEAQCQVMHLHELALQEQQDSYVRFVDAVQRNDPMLIQRLAWHQLNLRPARSQPLDRPIPVIDRPVPTIDQWVRTSVRLPAAVGPVAGTGLADSHLMRLVNEPLTRPWVLAFGGWLILAGLLLRSGPEAEEQKEAAAVAVAEADATSTG